MALPLFTFCPEFGAREIRAPRTSPVKFGNGKERRYRFGLVTDLRTWELSFDYNTDTRREQILAFLEERGAWKVFEWTDPKGYFGRWRCKEWRTTWNGHRQQTITCTFLEVDERAAVAGEPADGLADMWLSRVTTPVETVRNRGGGIDGEGNNYHVCEIVEQDSPEFFQLYIFKRDASGVLLWQKKIADWKATGVGGDNFNVHSDNENNLHLIERFTIGGSGSEIRLRVTKISPAGVILWRKGYQYFDGNFVGSVFILDSTYNPINNTVCVVSTRSGGSGSGIGPDIIIHVISAGDGAVVGVRRLNNVLFVNSTSFAAPTQGSLHIRNARMYVAVSTVSGGSGYTYIAELSLDLTTIFSSYRLAGFTAGWIYPTAGGWNAHSSDIGGALNVNRLMGLNQQFDPLWLQKDVGNSGTTITRSNVKALYPEQNGIVLYVGNNLARVANSNITNYDVLFYDHNVTLNGTSATNCMPGGGLFGSSDISNTLTQTADLYNFNQQRVVGWGVRQLALQGYKIAVFSHEAPMPDAALRYLDTGVSVNSSFFMEVRGQLGGEITPMEFDDSNQLPLKTEYTATDASISLTIIDEPEVSLVNGILDIAYYAYSDPEYTAPAATGNANLVFYGGNSSVQRVSVERSFEPALLVIANRAASNRKTVFNTFFNPRFYQAWAGTRSSVTVDGLVELAQGNFKVAGRMDSLNLASNNFVAFALGAIAGAHEIVSYVGTGAIRTISHSLGSTPAFVLFQGDNSTITLAGTALGGTGLNYDPGSSSAVATSSTSFIRSIGSSSIEIGNVSTINSNGTQYRMHVFQSSDDWTIDNVSGPGTGTFTVSLGFQPKAILFKGATGVGTAWQLLYRVDGTTGIARSLPLNAGSAVEADSAFASITADGFTILQGGPGNTGSSSAFYLAIK
jgi:phage-related protein